MALEYGNIDKKMEVLGEETQKVGPYTGPDI